jgi:hypothetical protein
MHSLPSSRQNATDIDTIRDPSATENAPSTRVVADPDLAIVVDSWHRLPEAIRAGILAMVKSSEG